MAKWRAEPATARVVEEALSGENGWGTLAPTFGEEWQTPTEHPAGLVSALAANPAGFGESVTVEPPTRCWFGLGLPVRGDLVLFMGGDGSRLAK